MKYLINELGVKPEKLGYFVGHEQERDWIGKETELFKYYKHSAIATKNVNPKIKVGGIGASGWGASKVPCNWDWWADFARQWCIIEEHWPSNGEPINKNLIKYVSDNGLPLDFLNYHSFGTSPWEHKRAAETMRQWLIENNFDENTPLYPADWTMWAGAYPVDYLDTADPVSYVVHSIYYMNEAGIQWHGHDFNVGLDYVPGKDLEKTEFLGSWAIFTPRLVIKPVYNSFRSLSILNGKPENQIPNRLQASFNEDDFITAISSQTKDKTKTRILLSNFIPSGNMLRNYIWATILPTYKSCLLAEGYTEEQNKLIHDSLKTTAKNYPPETDPDKDGSKEINLNYLTWIINNTDFPDPFNDVKVRQDLNSCTLLVQDKIDEIKNYSKNPRQVNLNISNLSPGNYTLKTYTIDKDHSNSCRYNKRTEPIPTNTECGINGAVDKAVVQAKSEAKQKAIQEAINYLKTKGYTDQQITAIKSQLIEPCLKEEDFKKCLASKIQTICSKYPKLNCDTLKQDLTDAYKIYREAKDKLFYYGKYTNSKGITITTSIYIDKINNDPNVSLEGSRQESQITVTNGTYKSTITMQPYSIVLLDFLKNR